MGTKTTQNNIKTEISGIEGATNGNTSQGSNSNQTTTKYKGFNVVGTIQIPAIDLKYPILEKLKTVIFDELQYLGDVDRGGIWEQSIMFTDPEVQILSLSG